MAAGDSLTWISTLLDLQATLGDDEHEPRGQCDRLAARCRPRHASPARRL